MRKRFGVYTMASVSWFCWLRCWCFYLLLFSKFEAKLEEFNGNLMRAAVELAKDWRTDRVLRRLEALLIVTDQEHMLIISGNGEVIEPDDGVTAIGSGGSWCFGCCASFSTALYALCFWNCSRSTFDCLKYLCIHKWSCYSWRIVTWSW